MKKLVLASAIAASFAGFTSVAQAEVSANVGVVSDYYFRGVNLGDAGAYAGIDYEASGFYAGVWAIDDGETSVDDDGEPAYGNDGLEYDVYVGYAGESGDFSYSVGYSLYNYTYTSDKEGEINLGLGFGGFGFEAAIGEDMNEDPGTVDFDYEFFAVSYSGDVYGVTLGMYENDLDESYNYFEFSAGGEVSGLDMGVTLGTAFDAEAADGSSINDLDGYLVLDISKSFSL